MQRDCEMHCAVLTDQNLLTILTAPVPAQESGNSTEATSSTKFQTTCMNHLHDTEFCWLNHII